MLKKWMEDIARFTTPNIILWLLLQCGVENWRCSPNATIFTSVFDEINICCHGELYDGVGFGASHLSLFTDAPQQRNLVYTWTNNTQKHINFTRLECNTQKHINCTRLECNTQKHINCTRLECNTSRVVKKNSLILVCQAHPFFLNPGFLRKNPAFFRKKFCKKWIFKFCFFQLFFNY